VPVWQEGLDKKLKKFSERKEQWEENALQKPFGY